MSNKQSHITSLAASVRTIYLALVDNSAIVSCFLEHQLIDSPFSMKKKPDVDF